MADLATMLEWWIGVAEMRSDNDVLLRGAAGEPVVLVADFIELCRNELRAMRSETAACSQFSKGHATDNCGNCGKPSAAHTDKLHSDTPRTDGIAHGFYPGGWMNMHEATLHYGMMLDLARQLERDLCTALAEKHQWRHEARTAAQSAGVERTGYVPFSREEIEDLRPDYGAPMVADVRASDMRKLCDMASNALLYAQEIDRLRSMPSASAALGQWQTGTPPINQDCRKFCWIETKDGMAYTGVRAWDFQRGCWISNGEPMPETEWVTHWMPLPGRPSAATDRTTPPE